MRALLPAVALLALCGCSLAPNRDEWTDQERVAFGLSTTAHIADLGTTMSALDGGRCSEANPLLGGAPSDATLIAVKALAIGLEYAYYNSPASRGEHSHWLGYVSAAVVGSIVVWNLNQDCY